MNEISGRQSISLSYLEQLFAKLRRGGLVNSVRGPGGGYQLSRNSEDIDVAEVVDAVNESMDATRCGNLANCQDGEKCLTHHLWCDLSAQIHSFLSSITLASLIEREEIQRTAKRQIKSQLERIQTNTQTV